jgi:hypothetical protein
MSQLARLLIITVLSSLGSVLAIRGVPFLAHDALGFGDVGNLLLSLTFGLLYVPSALLSHRLCVGLGERRCLAVAIGFEAAVFAALGAFWRHPASMYACMAVMGIAGGIKWPVLESYISAGRAGTRQARAIGQFNLAWAGAYPFALGAAGPVIRFWPPGLFLLAMLTDLIVLAVLAPLPARPVHLAQDHPDRLDAQDLSRWGRLRTAGRLLNLLSQSSIGVLAALMPSIFANLGYTVTWSTSLAGVMDTVRLGSFIALQWYTGWHGRRSPLAGAMLFLAAGFFLVLLGGSTSAVLAGEVIFGIGSAMAYYASLYYGMAVHNAAVEAGGVHEALIGLGMAVGSVSGVAAMWLGPPLGSDLAGHLVGMGPLFILTLAAAGWHLLGAGKPPGDSS